MRTLAIASLSYTAAVLLSLYCLPLAWLPAAAGFFALLGLLLFWKKERWLRGFALSCCALGFGFGLVFVHSLFTLVPAAACEGLESEFRAQLVDYPENNERYVRAQVRLDCDGLPRLKALLYDNSGMLLEAEPGDWVEGRARFRAADRLYGEAYLGYQSRDIYLNASGKGELRLTEGSGLRFWPLRLNHALCVLQEKLFPADVLPFVRALMLGNKELLYRDKPLELALSRAGLMHAVAVSGLHVSFLVGLIQTVLGRGKRSALICLCAVWVYVVITGASPSAFRAGVMQSLLLLAPLFGRENDPVTSLSFALGLLLLANPRAGANVGLQFSFASMAGILCFSERMSDYCFDRWTFMQASALRRGVVGTLVNSLCVMPFTVPLMVWYFGSFPILSPLSNLLVFWALELCFCGSYLCCALGLLFLPLGRAAAWLVSWVPRYIILAAKAVSSLPFAAVYPDHISLFLWLWLSYALFLAFRFVRVGSVKKLLYPALLSILLLVGVGFGLRLHYSGQNDTITALDVGQGQCLAVLSGEHTLLIDCGGGGTTDDAGEVAGAYLLNRGHRRVDALILTHLDEDHTNGVELLLELCDVRRLLMVPEPEADARASELIETAERKGVALTLLTEDTQLTLGGISAALYLPQENAKGNERCLALRVSLGEYDMLVTGDRSAKGEKALLAEHNLGETELFIAGHHGSKKASCEELLDAIRPQTVIVSCGYNTYGHPAPEALARFAARGCTVLRTDEQGSVELRIKHEHGET